VTIGGLKPDRGVVTGSTTIEAARDSGLVRYGRVALGIVPSGLSHERSESLHQPVAKEPLGLGWVGL